jgi:hypothetical protein
VESVQRDAVIVSCLHDIRVGDGVVFETGSAQDEEPGGVVEKVLKASNRTQQPGAVGKGLIRGPESQNVEQQNILFVRGLNTADVAVGRLCWRTKQEGLLATVRRQYERTSVKEQRRIAVDAVISGDLGEPVKLILQVCIWLKSSLC